MLDKALALEQGPRYLDVKKNPKNSKISKKGPTTYFIWLKVESILGNYLYGILLDRFLSEIWSPAANLHHNLLISAEDVTCLDIKHVSSGSMLVFWSTSSKAGASANIITQLMWHYDNPVQHCLHLLFIFIRLLKLLFSVFQHYLMWSINTAEGCIALCTYISVNEPPQPVVTTMSEWT